MSEYGANYTRMRFSHASGIDVKRIINETDLDYMEIVYELDDGRKILFDGVTNIIKEIGNTGLDYVPDELWKKEFSRRLNKMIVRKGIYRSDFAEMLGISGNTMSYYTTGKRIPNIRLVQQMAKILECSLDYLTNFDYLL